MKQCNHGNKYGLGIFNPFRNACGTSLKVTVIVDFRFLRRPIWIQQTYRVLRRVRPNILAPDRRFRGAHCTSPEVVVLMVYASEKLFSFKETTRRSIPEGCPSSYSPPWEPNFRLIVMAPSIQFYSCMSNRRLFPETKHALRQDAFYTKKEFSLLHAKRIKGM
jgi:hypothetical protein